MNPPSVSYPVHIPVCVSELTPHQVEMPPELYRTIIYEHNVKMLQVHQLWRSEPVTVYQHVY
jgi:hypothetical protein